MAKDQGTSETTQQYDIQQKDQSSIEDFVTFPSNINIQQPVPPQEIQEEPVHEQQELIDFPEPIDKPQVDEPQVQEEAPAIRRSTRQRQEPTYLKNFVK